MELSKNSNIEVFFIALNEVAETLENEGELTYLEGLANAAEFFFQEEIQQELSELALKKLKRVYHELDLVVLTKEEIRKGMQLAILKGMKQASQANHAITPDAVALFMGYLIKKLVAKEDKVRILDPAVGSANLLTAILNHLSKPFESYGIEPDETLLKLAYASANLQQHEINFFHQDSLTEVFVSPVDLVIADLPVGYYPNEEIARHYRLKADKGLSYTHHLLIEQSLNYTKEGGFLLFLVPNVLFETEEAKKLHAYIKEHAFIYSLIQLPNTMFKQEKYGKSIFIIRKKASSVQGPKQALLAELPSFSNKQQALSDMMKTITNWLDAYVN